MTHFCELFTSQTIRTLRGANFEQEAANNEHISPEIYLSWDDEEGEVTVKTATQSNTLLDLGIEIGAAPRWFSLNIGLGRGHFAAGDCLGLIIEAESATPVELAPFVRSAMEDGHGDTVLEAQSLPTGGRQVLSLLHVIKDEDAVTNDSFQTLVLPLPAESLTLSLHDLRLFVIPAAQVEAVWAD
jgi:hypothetical protein